VRDLFVSATNDIESYLIECDSFGKVGIEDCWFGYYPAMAYGPNFYGPILGFVPPAYPGGSYAHYLCGIYLEGGSLDDIAWVNNCDFGGLACGLLNDCDHSVVDNKMFLFCGNKSSLPNTGAISSFGAYASLVSLASLGVCIVQGHSTHMNCRYHNNYFYGGNFAYAMDDYYGASAVVSDGDGFESMEGDLFISPQSKFTQINAHGGVPSSVAITDSYWGSGQPYAPAYTDPNASIRTVELNYDNASFTGYSTFEFGNANVYLPTTTTLTGSGANLTALNAGQLTGTAPVGVFPGISTNYTIAGGPTLYVTNGVIMAIH
jgi:hypothetical protein